MASCPHCTKEFSLSPKILDKETLTMRITWEGEMIEAKTVGGVIENTRKLLLSVAKEAGMKKPYVGMSGIDFGVKEAAFHFAIFDAGRAQPQNGGGDGQ